MTNDWTNDEGNAPDVPCLALRPQEAAKAIGVGSRTLATLTKAGKVPHFRLGRAVLYPVDCLRDWMRQLTNEPA